MENATVTENEEERATTKYINDLQSKETFSDSLYWTMQDRRAALWWIYIHSKYDLGLTALYACDRCTKSENQRRLAEHVENGGEPADYQPISIRHAVDYNAKDFADSYNVLPIQPYQETKIFIDGAAYNGKLMLLNGYAAEKLESMLEMADETDNDEAREGILKSLRVARICYQFSLEGEPDDIEAALQYRWAKLNEMTAGGEFEELVAKIALMNKELAHGLTMKVEDGRSFLRVPRLGLCPAFNDLPVEQQTKEARVKHTTELWVPFRNSELFANLRPERLADFGI